MILEKIKEQTAAAVKELLETAKLTAGDILVVGCSTSEVLGQKIGTYSSKETAEAIFEGLAPLLREKGVFLAAQCCEHLNRALIMEKQAACQYMLEQVNAVPQPKAGGSFAAVCYERFASPTVVEEIHCAKAGMDIGNTLIGMHLAKVAVPVRLSVQEIGQAHLVCARTRPKFIGGIRAQYDQNLL